MGGEEDKARLRDAVEQWERKRINILSIARASKEEEAERGAPLSAAISQFHTEHAGIRPVAALSFHRMFGVILGCCPKVTKQGRSECYAFFYFFLCLT